MGKWSEQYIGKKSAPLTETTANSRQKPNQTGDDPLLAVIGSGFCQRCRIFFNVPFSPLTHGQSPR